LVGLLQAFDMPAAGWPWSTRTVNRYWRVATNVSNLSENQSLPEVEEPMEERGLRLRATRAKKKK
jgi:hypothetical protein